MISTSLKHYCHPNSSHCLLFDSSIVLAVDWHERNRGGNGNASCVEEGSYFSKKLLKFTKLLLSKAIHSLNGTCLFWEGFKPLQCTSGPFFLWLSPNLGVALLQVIYGCGNDKFGGCGSILEIHVQGCGGCGAPAGGVIGRRDNDWYRAMK